MRTLVVDVTYRCNSPCQYCQWGSPALRKPDLSLPEVCIPGTTLAAWPEYTMGSRATVGSNGRRSAFSSTPRPNDFRERPPSSRLQLTAASPEVCGGAENPPLHFLPNASVDDDAPLDAGSQFIRGVVEFAEGEKSAVEVY